MPLRNYKNVRKAVPHWFPRQQEKYAEETRERVLSRHYLQQFGYRLEPIVFSAIPEMMRIAVGTRYINDFFRQEVIGHLMDAFNSKLPHYVRVQHFDLAGARYWEGTGRGQSTVPRFMTLFRDAGGK